MTTLMDKPTPVLDKKLKHTPPILKALWRPMLALALGIHAVLLFMPLTPEKKELPQPTEKPVKIARLSNQKVTIKPKPKPKVAAPKPVVKRNVTPPPTLVVKATPTPSPTPSSPGSTTPSPSPSTSPSHSSTDNAPSSDPEAKDFADPLDSIVAPGTTTPLRNTDPSLKIGSLLFKDPTPFYSDLDKDTPKPGVSAVEYLAPLTEDVEVAVKDLIEPAYTGNGFTFDKVGDYGGGPVYKVTKGSVTRYLNFVKSQTGVLIVVWKKSPV